MTSSLRRRCAFEEMLSSDEQRDAYDHLGEDAARARREPDRVRLGTETAAFCALWAIVAFALTDPDAARRQRARRSARDAD